MILSRYVASLEQVIIVSIIVRNRPQPCFSHVMLHYVHHRYTAAFSSLFYSSWVQCCARCFKTVSSRSFLKMFLKIFLHLHVHLYLPYFTKWWWYYNGIFLYINCNVFIREVWKTVNITVDVCNCWKSVAFWQLQKTHLQFIYGWSLPYTHRRSIAKLGRCLWVCQHDNFRRIKHILVEWWNLVVRCFVGYKNLARVRIWGSYASPHHPTVYTT